MAVDPGVDLVGIEVQDRSPLDDRDASFGDEAADVAHGDAEAVGAPAMSSSARRRSVGFAMMGSSLGSVHLIGPHHGDVVVLRAMAALEAVLDTGRVAPV